MHTFFLPGGAAQMVELPSLKMNFASNGSRRTR